jgi:site-specific DNA-methyltransferase (adenine-specific)
MEATTDLWEISAESATRVGHPAPFPVELPKRLIELYTYRGDLVLDPFMGSGSTAVASVRSERHFVGYDTDATYVEQAMDRVKQEHEGRPLRPPRPALPAIPRLASENEGHQARAVREGESAKEIARAVMKDCGFKQIEDDASFPGGVEVHFVAKDDQGQEWLFDVSGAFASTRAGLRRTDTVWKALGKASVLQASGPSDYRLILLTTDLPPRTSTGGRALRAAQNDTFHDAIAMLSEEGQRRLRFYASGSNRSEVADEVFLPARDEL